MVCARATRGDGRRRRRRHPTSLFFCFLGFIARVIVWDLLLMYSGLLDLHREERRRSSPNTIEVDLILHEPRRLRLIVLAAQDPSRGGEEKKGGAVQGKELEGIQQIGKNEIQIATPLIHTRRKRAQRGCRCHRRTCSETRPSADATRAGTPKDPDKQKKTKKKKRRVSERTRNKQRNKPATQPPPLYPPP